MVNRIRKHKRISEANVEKRPLLVETVIEPLLLGFLRRAILRLLPIDLPVLLLQLIQEPLILQWLGIILLHDVHHENQNCCELRD